MGKIAGNTAMSFIYQGCNLSTEFILVFSNNNNNNNNNQNGGWRWLMVMINSSVNRQELNRQLLSFFKLKYQTHAGFSFSNGRTYCFYLSYSECMIAHFISLGFGLLVGQGKTLKMSTWALPKYIGHFIDKVMN